MKKPDLVVDEVLQLGSNNHEAWDLHEQLKDVYKHVKKYSQKDPEI